MHATIIRSIWCGQLLWIRTEWRLVQTSMDREDRIVREIAASCRQAKLNHSMETSGRQCKTYGRTRPSSTLLRKTDMEREAFSRCINQWRRTSGHQQPTSVIHKTANSISLARISLMSQGSRRKNSTGNACSWTAHSIICGKSCKVWWSKVKFESKEIQMQHWTRA